MNIKRQMEHASNMQEDMVNLSLTKTEAEALKQKLQWLMDEANGVDIWLAPGGTSDDAVDCFLDCDEEAHYCLGKILERLGGSFNPHRSGNFDKSVDSTISNDLIEAYEGYYEDKEDPECAAMTPEEHILSHTPRQRLNIYCEWNGLLGYSDRLFEIATGET